MMNLDGVAAIVFDLDGVLLESADIKTEAFLELFGAYPQFREAIREYHLSHLGVSRYDKFEWIYRELLNEPLSAEEKARLGVEFSELALDKILQCPFVPGAREALDALYEHTLLFVASGTPQEELVLILERREMARYFRGAWGSPTKKPNVVREVLERYGLRPQQVLFVGDGSSDYEAARETGVQFLARVTPELADYWQSLGVESASDLWGLAEGKRQVQVKS